VRKEDSSGRKRNKTTKLANEQFEGDMK